ncbi:UNVERIFIED_CONTAM: tusE [Trichonephila clavipes]
MQKHTLFLVQAPYANLDKIWTELPLMAQANDSIVVMGEALLHIPENILATFSHIYCLSYFMQLELDQDGHLVDYTIWNQEVAQELAKSLDLELTEWHFEVLNAVRQFYQQYGHSPATRPLIKFLMKTVSPEINNAALQQRFNTGLVARHLSRLAGVPKPANCL